MLLTEAATAGEIRKAISDRAIVKFRYDTKGDPNLAPDWRSVQIYAYGAVKDKKAGDYQPVIRGFELYGDYSGNKKGGWRNSKFPAWKLFLVNRIKPGTFTITDETFDEPFSDIYPNIPAFNPVDDKSMAIVWSIIEFPERPQELAYVKGNERLFDKNKNKLNTKLVNKPKPEEVVKPEETNNNNNVEGNEEENI